MAPIASVMSATVRTPATAHAFQTASLLCRVSSHSHTPRPVWSRKLCQSGSDLAHSIVGASRTLKHAWLTKKEYMRKRQCCGINFDLVRTFAFSRCRERKLQRPTNCGLHPLEVAIAPQSRNTYYLCSKPANVCMYVLLHFDIKRTLTKRVRRIYMSSSLFIGRCSLGP
eukprot:SAG31_NODE_60_length_29419_cov_39.876398_12_plen_169_part_00